MIELKNVSFSYYLPEKVDVIKNINLIVNKGEFLVIIGRNGSGKSTLGRLISFILEPTEGEVLIDKKPKTEIDYLDIRKKIGMVFQNPDNQIVSQIVEEDVAFGLENLNYSEEEIREKIDDVLNEVGLIEFRKFPPNFLSGGQKQKLAIAGILVMEPQYLVLDEPTSLLDPKGRKDVIELIKKLNKKGITIILITHRMEEAILGDRVLVLNDGEIFLEGNPEEVFTEVEKIRSVGLSPPVFTYLSYLIKKENFNIDIKLWKLEEIKKEILQLKSKI
ncbi:MAG TPA: energy-coupling factor transporter ATPase [Caldisericia bacterium]|nr:energy-coupling factor transporter ATPase [Caldisericia bacterium]HON83595.1 energy-coupling factor transporter ATPase [Caldisericia bacterium]HPC56486.1 energy-coupling factor transporter ATPase [Caldisericia bacterium]HPP43293.1 energy-coupling factor transporter ATPase [Caldisericia bacterium]HRU73574.1 energy-coupling factor transporter ATPase [Caldisericia bacterium]